MKIQTGAAGLAIALLGWTAGALAQGPDNGNAFTELGQRWYISSLYSHIDADGRRQTDDGDGWTLAVGKNVNRYFNLELYGFRADYDVLGSSERSASVDGIGLAAYGFPFAQRDDGLGRWLGGGYGLIGVGYGESEDFPLRAGRFDSNGSRFFLDAGLGHLLRIPFIRVASLRLDARYRLDLDRHPFASVADDDDNDNPEFGDVVWSVGFVIPLGSRSQSSPVARRAPATVAVVPPIIEMAPTQ